MFYDLAALHCWASDQVVRDKSGVTLMPFVQAGSKNESICNKLVPSGWDSLHTPRYESETYIKKINQNDDARFDLLKANWFNIVTKYPLDYIKVKSNFLAQVLSMGNSLSQGRQFIERQSVMNTFTSLIIFPLYIFDKLFVFTILGFSLFLLCFRKFNFEIILIFIMLVVNSLIVYIANNGRYVVGYLLISLLFLKPGVSRKLMKRKSIE